MTLQEFKDRFGIIGKSKEINDIADICMQVAKSDVTVLIYGESGVGKEIFARAIHGYSNRADKPLVSVNCGAIPEGILESELFGHKRGSFTGAIETRKGYFEIADGGTLFLDEIGETPLTTQVKLLRVIELKEFMKIGAETVSKVDVRLICATNQDLQKLVDEKKFREDLYFRLKAVTLYIPPLRNRRSDIRDLVTHFVKSYAGENNLEQPVITEDAMNLLMKYHWPGNVRELKNTLESALALNKTGKLDAAAFEHLLLEQTEDAGSRNLPVFLKRSPEEVDRELLYRALFELKKDILELKDLVTDRNREIYAKMSQEENEEVLPLEELQKNAIENALKVTHGNKRTAARMLNISERTLYRKIKEYGLPY
ncbi:MAG: sigma-54 dependent transcriptional regulator [Ignavibacteriaceae bacterium]